MGVLPQKRSPATGRSTGQPVGKREKPSDSNKVLGEMRAAAA